jgi:hypothetical protein
METESYQDTSNSDTTENRSTKHESTTKGTFMDEVTGSDTRHIDRKSDNTSEEKHKTDISGKSSSETEGKSSFKNFGTRTLCRRDGN